MKRFPKAAEPVRKHILATVKRPSLDDLALSEVIRFFVNADSCCPMGMLPEAISGVPETLNYFSDAVPFDQDAMTAFWVWWDGIPRKDAAKAIHAVWGPENNNPTGP